MISELKDIRSSRVSAGRDAGEFLSDQLIAYIGNKRKLLNLINQAIHQTGVQNGCFFDAFSGSGVVSRLAKVLGFQVISNDWEPYAWFINQTFTCQNILPAFKSHGGVSGMFQHLDSLPGIPGYIAGHYCPADDENPDYDRERMFFTQENGRRLDAMREEVASLHQQGQITQNEHDLLVACLVFATSWCSNTSGVFKGFHRGWGGATQTAWYRIRETVRLRPPILYDNGEQNLAFQQDATLLAPEISCDIAYLDPPYNQHQYGANYHLLNTVALWDKPEIPPRFKPGERGIKAAIRLDWRTQRNSLYCRRRYAADEMNRLVNALDARWILVSYSTDGMIPVEDLVDVLNQAGRLSWVYKPYKRYRVSSQRPSARGHNLEFVLIVENGERRNPGARSDILKTCEALANKGKQLQEASAC